MTRIVVPTEELRSVANQFRQASTDSDSMINSLATSINQLGSDWAGLSQQKFLNDFEEWKAGMAKYRDLLQQINDVLVAIAQRFEDADRPN